MEKYDIEVRNDDAIKRNRIFFDFIQQTFNHLDESHLCEKCLLIDTIIKYQLKNQSAVEIEKLNRVKKAKNKRNEGKSKPSPKRACL